VGVARARAPPSRGWPWSVLDVERQRRRIWRRYDRPPRRQRPRREPDDDHLLDFRPAPGVQCDRRHVRALRQEGEIPADRSQRPESPPSASARSGMPSVVMSSDRPSAKFPPTAPVVRSARRSAGQRSRPGSLRAAAATSSTSADSCPRAPAPDIKSANKPDNLGRGQRTLRPASQASSFARC